MSEIPQSVEFGWGASPMSEQLPMIDKAAAAHFDLDNTAIIRLHMRDMITDSQRDAAFKKLTKKICAEIKKSLSAKILAEAHGE